jgi:ketosteroid isomerase-like protein
MSVQKEVLQTIAARLSGGDTAGLEDHFTDDFQLHDPATPHWPRGKDGARLMVEKFVALDKLRLEALDMVEENDCVAVRWRVTWVDEGETRRAAIIAIYRFEGERIAEDWGVATRSPWPDG